MVYFSEIFGIEESVLENYGAFNISLLNDLPLFIDPFLLYASDKPNYQKLHEEILDYLTFLRNKAIKGQLTPIKIKRWFYFPEVKQVWFGYSETGNRGSGLGGSFGNAMSKVIVSVFNDLRNESISDSSHLEKLGLFRSGVGRDNISDFTCNLIKHFLLEYTQTFALQYLAPSQYREFSVLKAYFDYKNETWCSKSYKLPYFNDDYILLTPKDILTKDENWINFNDMKHQFFSITSSIPNDELRDRLNDMYLRTLPKKPKDEDITNAITYLVSRHPEIMDYYIRLKENDKDGAKKASTKIVADASHIYIRNITSLRKLLEEYTDFYTCAEIESFEATRRRVLFLKDMIENKDGYLFFYCNNKPIQREKDLQLLFKLTWFATSFDVNAEVNNGRGSVDYKISFGKSDTTLVEFKLASNSKLKQNLKNQVHIYEKANDTTQSMKVILYFSEKEHKRVLSVLHELKLESDPNIILIDACNNKPSASNVK